MSPACTTAVTSISTPLMLSLSPIITFFRDAILYYNIERTLPASHSLFMLICVEYIIDLQHGRPRSMPARRINREVCDFSAPTPAGALAL
ncbi:unnamed protein product [Amoebophrya sp. A25]|nr:unnamed protein product [Amoebophrya sp. A25]|eukprot:GSA25T00014000001.1